MAASIKEAIQEILIKRIRIADTAKLAKEICDMLEAREAEKLTRMSKVSGLSSSARISVQIGRSTSQVRQR